ncbi:MAG: GntR family transcriptional regulator [Rhizobiaceae bacterium]
MPAKAKRTLVDQAYHGIKRRIRENQMPPGSNMPEQQLAESLGVSRTPVREALIRLESEGLVEVVPRHGVRVLPVKTEDMREIYDILTALEPFAAMQLAKSGPDPRMLEKMQHAVEEMEAALASQDLDRWARGDELFHRELLEALGNRRLSAFVERLNDQAHRARMITLRMREVPRESTLEQRAILEALRAADGKKVERLFRKHRERVASELTDILSKLQIANL